MTGLGFLRRTTSRVWTLIPAGRPPTPISHSPIPGALTAAPRGRRPSTAILPPLGAGIAILSRCGATNQQVSVTSAPWRPRVPVGSAAACPRPSPSPGPAPKSCHQPAGISGWWRPSWPEQLGPRRPVPGPRSQQVQELRTLRQPRRPEAPGGQQTDRGPPRGRGL